MLRFRSGRSLMRFVSLLIVTTIAMTLSLNVGAQSSGDEWTNGDRTIEFWPADEGARLNERALEDRLVSHVSRDRLRALHELLASRPHRAGTEGDRRANEAMAALFDMLGLEVERQKLEVYLSDPISASVEVVEPDRIELSIREESIETDPFLSDPDLDFGFNAYSGSGDVTAGVVYANYGRKQDFARLRELGIDCTGKIVLARYGGNFRGYKAKFAEQAGAAGLIIYTDPGDSGYARGEMYPDGGWANESYIQRGSIKTLPYSGDPLTPFVPATPDAERLDPADIALPSIPVQPIGWKSAAEIIGRMNGETLTDESWIGGLEHTYRLTGGPDLRVRLQVEQSRGLKEIENIVASIPGAVYPEQKIIIGAHHDAWGFGAGDPTSGTIVVFELARLFAEMARQGIWPKRSLVFACWGAEEYGIIGSTEWVEAHADDLTKSAVAYLNLDMASMGLNFGSSAAPVLKDVILDATRFVPQPIEGDEAPALSESLPVFDHWLARINTGREQPFMEPHPGSLGGGSDHVGFYCHLGIPSAGLSAHGSPGVSYHSNYDNLRWYRQVVGDDYEAAALVAGVTAITAWRLANAPVIPYSPRRYADDTRRHLEGIRSRAVAYGLIDEDEAVAELETLQVAIDRFEGAAVDAMSSVKQGIAPRDLTANQIAAINQRLINLERTWLREQGIPGRPWYRSLYAATDEDSGYASWMLPALRFAVEHRDRALLLEATSWYVDIFDDLEAQMRAINDIAGE